MIKVVCRFRPQNSREIAEGGEFVVKVQENTCVFNSKEYPGTFSFDRIFDWNSTQIQVFEHSVKPIVDDVLEGYNGTVFAYGQTGSGKTFTMMGADIDDERLRGVVPRISEQIFHRISTSSSELEFTVRVSYMEIYMEKIRDLLNPSNDNLSIHEDKLRGVYVKNLVEVYVGGISEVYEVMRRGAQARVVAYTNMNAESSRSHSIFVLTISQRHLGTGSSKSGTLFLVDLAGSEKVGKTGASGQTLEEAKKINKSLSALGNVINALTDGKAKHVPYRDSKLTRILQQSLGGNSRTTLIINASPSSFNEAETIGTLRFGMRAKNIENKAVVNQEFSAAELKILLKDAKTKLLTFQAYSQILEDEVKVWRNGGKVEEAAFASIDRLDVLKTSDSNVVGAPSLSDAALKHEAQDELMDRENELEDQLTERESQLEKALVTLIDLETQFKEMKKASSVVKTENESFKKIIDETRVEIEHLRFLQKETEIAADALKEELILKDKTIQDLMKQKCESRTRRMSVIEGSEDKERQREEKLKAMMSQYRQETDNSNMQQIETFQLKIREQDELIKEKELKLEEAQDRILKLQAEYDDLLEKTIVQNQPDDSHNFELLDLKSKLESQYEAKSSSLEETIQQLKQDIASKQDVIHQLNEEKQANADLRDDTENIQSADQDTQKSIQLLSQQRSEFDSIKKGLMCDLQDRCERVVELEMQLEESQQLYATLLRDTNGRIYQKKVAVMERNLEQLTSVQKQIISQNSSLKNEVAILDRKLQARNERITSLETMLREAQEKLEIQSTQFEKQLDDLSSKLEKTSLQSSQFNQGRIAKPLRGGDGSQNSEAFDSSLPSAVMRSSRGEVTSSWFMRIVK